MPKKSSKPDVENPEWTREEMRAARPAHEVFPDAFRDVPVSKRTRGQRGPQKTPTKVAINIRLEPDVVDTYKSSGRGWQVRMGEDLAKAAKRLRQRAART